MHPEAAPSSRSFYVANLARGFLMGAADIVPGVSGGTVALILGIYPRLVTAISRIDVRALKLLRQGKLTQLARHLDLLFLVSLLTGIVVGIGGLASLMHYLLESHMQHTYAAFFGLILASALLIARLIDTWSLPLLAALGLGAGGAYVIVGMPMLINPPDGLLYTFFAGAIAICAMILPGISGSFILLILGKYAPITALLRGFVGGDFSLSTVLTLATFCLGCALGLVGFSKFLRWLLARYERLTMAVLCGFMLGSLRRIWPFRAPPRPADELGTNMAVHLPEAVWPSSWDEQTWLSVGLCVGAFSLVWVLDRLASQHPLSPSR